MAPAHPHATGVAVYPALFFIKLGKRPNSLRRKNVAREQKNGMEPFWIFPCKARKTVKNVYMNQGKYDSESWRRELSIGVSFECQLWEQDIVFPLLLLS